VLHDVLARLGERHREAHRRARVEPELALQDRLRALLDAADHVVHVAGLPDRGDLEQHLRAPRRPRPRRRLREVEQRLACLKKPVRAQYDSVSSASGITNDGRSARVCARVSSAVSPYGEAHRAWPRVEQQAGVGGHGRELREDLLERLVVERGGKRDHGGHSSDISPRR
jgi:hypothetical protein